MLMSITTQNTLCFSVRIGECKEARIVVQARADQADDDGTMAGEKDSGFDAAPRYVSLLHIEPLAALTTT